MVEEFLCITAFKHLYEYRVPNTQSLSRKQFNNTWSNAFTKNLRLTPPIYNYCRCPSPWYIQLSSTSQLGASIKIGFGCLVYVWRSRAIFRSVLHLPQWYVWAWCQLSLIWLVWTYSQHSILREIPFDFQDSSCVVLKCSLSCLLLLLERFRSYAERIWFHDENSTPISQAKIGSKQDLSLHWPLLP
jgi:hypothetical protein